MATPYVGKATAYDLTNGVIVSMDEAIYMFSPMELPMLTGMGADGLSVISQKPVDQYKFNWLTEDNLAPRGTLGGAVTTGDTYIQLSSNHRARFSTGDRIMVRSTARTDATVEELLVTGYSVTTADMLICSRALTGTATTYASGDTVIGLGTVIIEGSDPENFRANDTDTVYNYTQIFGPTKISMSGTDRVIKRYGIPDQWAHHLAMRIYENGQHREQAFLYGQRYDDTSGKKRATGGLDYFITTNVDTTNTQVTELVLQTNLQNCWSYGSCPDRFMVNPKALTTLNAITDTGRVRVEDVSSRRGRARVTVVETEFGSLTIVRNRWLALQDAFGFRRENVTRRVLRPMQVEPLAKTGDADNLMFVCEEGLQVTGEKHAFKMTALT